MNTRLWWGIIILLFLIIAGMVVVFVVLPAPAQAPIVEESGEPIAASTSSGQSNTVPEPLHNRVVVVSPKSGETVGHTLTISGEAPGNWYFEASFPIKVTTPEGDRIGSGHADAQSDWMTTEQVPFTATINLTLSYSGPATIALLKDNPSGLPEHDDSIEVPIVVQ